MFQPTFRLNRTAVVGAIAVGMAIAVSSFSIVRAERAKPDNSKTYSCSSGTACLTANSSGKSTWGLYGTATTDDAVHGVTSSTNGNSGVAGISTGYSGNAHGVYGLSSNGVGVFGRTTSYDSYGVEGITSVAGATGVLGQSSYSGSQGSAGVVAVDYEGSPSGFALQALGEATSTILFLAEDVPDGAYCEIAGTGNLTCSGSIEGGQDLRVRHHNSSGQKVLTYASESATATIEDVGTARMSGGIANVQIDPAFASVMDHKWYYVFLTPLGDTRGLYVGMKTPSAFQVRETERGRDTLSFDYRIVAHPLDAKNDRLPLAPAVRLPRVMHPAH
jgi:hypothetical protein